MARNKVSLKVSADTDEFHVKMSRVDETVEKTNKAVKNSTKEVSKFEGAVRKTSNAIAVMEGPLGGIAGRFSAFGTSISNVGVTLATVGGAFAALGAAATKHLAVINQLEQSMGRLNGVLKATGNTAGLTAEQMREMADAVAMDTLESVDGVLQAQAALATFGMVGGESFETIIRLGADMTAVFGGDLTSNVRRLGAAFEDPVRGMTQLREQGLGLLPAQEEMIRNFQETGRSAEAASLLIQELTNRVGDAGKEIGSGLAGALDLLGQNVDYFFEELFDTSFAQDTAAAVTYIATKVRELGDAMNTNTIDEYEQEIKELTERLDGLNRSLNPLTRRGALKVEEELEEITRAYELFLSDRSKQIAAENKLEKEAEEARTRERAAADAERVRQLELRFQKTLQAEQERAKALELVGEDDAETKEIARYEREKLALDRRMQAVDKHFRNRIELQQAFATQAEEIERAHQANLDQIMLDEEEKILEHLETIQGIRQDAIDRDIENEKELFDAKTDLAQASVGIARATVTALAQIAEEGSAGQRAALALAKGLAVASASIDVAAAGAKALREGIGGAPSQIANMAAVLAAGANLITTISSVTVGSRAAGGDIIRPGNYLVGEAGREVVTLPSGAGVTPMKDLERGGDVNIQVIEDPSRAGQVDSSPDMTQIYVAAFRQQFMSDLGRGQGMARAMERRYGLQRRAGIA